MLGRPPAVKDAAHTAVKGETGRPSAHPPAVNHHTISSSCESSYESPFSGTLATHPSSLKLCESCYASSSYGSCECHTFVAGHLAMNRTNPAQCRRPSSYESHESHGCHTCRRSILHTLTPLHTSSHLFTPCTVPSSSQASSSRLEGHAVVAGHLAMNRTNPTYAPPVAGLFFSTVVACRRRLRNQWEQTRENSIE